MRSAHIFPVWLAAAFFVASSAVTFAAETRSEPVAYFLEQYPENLGVSDLPKDASDVIVAKVRLQEGPAYLGGRDQSGDPPTNQPKDILFTRVRLIEILAGSADIGRVVDVRFGRRGGAQKIVYPYTPDQLGREYIAVMYVDSSDNVRRLAAFPISQAQYSQWNVEQAAYTRLRGRPGFRDPH